MSSVVETGQGLEPKLQTLARNYLADAAILAER